MHRRPQPLLDRLADKFTVGDGCWQWQAARKPSGYGVFRDAGKNRPAHRVVYEVFVGPVPAGLDLDHLCRNRGCVRPDHLEPVTRSENLRRGIGGEARREQAAAMTTCKNGHPWTPENTRQGKQRHCRACAREATRRYRERSK